MVSNILIFIKDLPVVDPVTKAKIKLDVLKSVKQESEEEIEAIYWARSIDGIYDFDRINHLEKIKLGCSTSLQT